MPPSVGSAAVRALGATLLLLAVAGCVETPAAWDGDAATPASLAADEAPTPLGLAATACTEGGGHSVHPRMFDPLPDPWVAADVLDDVGPQLLYSEVPDPTSPVPKEGNTIGNYHATVWCEGWTLDGEPLEDVVFGFVGMKVEPPLFEDAAEPATHHYLVTVIASSHEEINARLRAAGIAAISASAARTSAPDGTLRIQMWTEGNGEYDSIFRPKEVGANGATRVRLWWQEGYGHGDHASASQAADGYRPLALDLVTTGGRHHVAEGQGYFSHSGTAHHAPLPGAYGHTAALLYDGFDRTFAFGPRPDVRFPDAYDH